MLLRKRPDGEVCALLPYEPGDGKGVTAVLFSPAGKFVPVDPHVVLANTQPATETEGFLVRSLLQKEGFEPELLSKLPHDHGTERIAAATNPPKFDRIRHLY